MTIVHNNQTEYGGGRREMETVAVTLVATVTMPTSTRPRQKMGEGGVTHDNKGVKEEARRWRMLMTMMMVVVGGQPR